MSRAFRGSPAAPSASSATTRRRSSSRRSSRRGRRASWASGPAEDDAGFMLFDTVLAFDHVKHRILIVANARITADEDLDALYQFACAKIQFLERELERGLSQRRGRAAQAAPEIRSNQTRGTFRDRRPDDQGADRGGRHLSGGAVAALRSGHHRRSVHRLSRAPARQPVAVHVFHPAGRPVDCRVVAGDAGAGRRAACGNAPDRGHAAARRQRRGRPAAGRGAEAQREGAGRARHARGPRPERSRPRLRVRIGAGAAVHGARALLARDASRVDRRRTLADDQDHLDALVACFPAGTVSGAPKIRAMQILSDARADAARCLCRRGRLHRFRRQSRFLHRHPHHHHPRRQGAHPGRAPASSPIRTRPPSTKRRATRPRALLQALAMAEEGL